MWYLANEKCADIRFSLPLGKDLVVGRKDCDILVPRDQSISRKHAIVRVQEGGKVTLTDCKSKFGTQVNGEKVLANSEVQLHHNDVIRFGHGPKDSTSVFRLVCEPLVLCCSGMSGPEKSRAKQLSRTLGASLVSNWSAECSHLIMSSVTVTVKVVSALASCRPIVTPAWLAEAAKCLRDNTVLPACSGYLPEVVDPNVSASSGEVSFTPDFRRRSLFQDRVFYFLAEKQYSRLGPCVKCASAQCRLATSQDSLPSLESLAAKESIVLAVGEDMLSELSAEQRQWIAQINTFLSSRGLRPVMDSEIGFALLQVSVDNYCNPRSPEGAPQITPHLPPPSFSQHALYSFHSTSLPFTQEQESQSQANNNVTVLAPDSEATHPQQHSLGVKREQNMEASTTQGSTIIDETVLRSSRKTKPPARREKAMPSTNTNPTIDSLFDPDLGHQSFPPAEVRSKLGKQPPVMSSTQQAEGDKGGGRGDGNGSQFHHPRPPALKSESSLVEDSQPDASQPDRTALPGLRFLSQEASLADRSGVLASQSVESNPSQDPSVLVPSSLTPRSQRDKTLPDPSLISELFKGRRKRGIEEREGEGGAGASQRASSQKRQCLEEKGKAEKSGAAGEGGVGAGMFSGLRSTRTRKRPTGRGLTDSASAKPPGSNPSNSSNHSQQLKVPTPTAHKDTPADKLLSEPDTDTARSGAAFEQDKEEGMEIAQSPLRPNKVPDTHTVLPEHSNSEAFKTPKRKRSSSGGGLSPFLSARRPKKSSVGDPSSDAAAPPTLGTQLSTDTQATGDLGMATQTQSTIRTDMTSLFTCLVMPLGTSGGRRSKIQETTGTEASNVEDLWDKDDGRTAGEGENPLGGNGSQWSSLNGHSMYTPVCTEDGFILPREKPRLKAPRMARLGLLANGGDPDSESSMEIAPPVEVAMVSLVVETVERRRREEEVDGMENESWRRIKNFKKFKKVQNAGAGIPRIVGLSEYVPEANRSRWLEEDREENQERERDEEEEEEEDGNRMEDLFIFTVPAKKTRAKK